MPIYNDSSGESRRCAPAGQSPELDSADQLDLSIEPPQLTGADKRAAAKKTSTKKKPATEVVDEATGELDQLWEEVKKTYRTLCNRLNRSPGDIAEAARHWRKMPLEDRQQVIPGIQAAEKLIFIAQRKGVDYLPHLVRALAGAPRNKHPTPYYLTWAEEWAEYEASNTVAADPPTLGSSRADRLRAKYGPAPYSASG